MEAVTTRNDDSARILAATGWQSDPRRLPVLRELLREHLKRIYLYAYEESRNRAAAIDRTRRTLLRVARTVQSIPAGCPFVTWVFLTLEEDQVYPEQNPDLWRLLLLAEQERQAEASRATTEARRDGVDGPIPVPSGPVRAEEASGPPPTAPIRAAAHPTLRPLVSLYRRFLDTPAAGRVEPRANWLGAEKDLEWFLLAQFADTGDVSGSPARAWRRWLAKRPWRRARNIAAAAALVVVITVGLVLVFTLRPPRGRWSGFFGPAQIEAAQDPETGALGADRRTPSARDRKTRSRSARDLLVSGTASVRIAEARCMLSTRDSLRFSWMPAPGVTEYRLCLVTAAHETLGVVPGITGTGVSIAVKAVPRMRVPGSFFFRVDGVSGGKLLAASDPQAFDVP